MCRRPKAMVERRARDVSLEFPDGGDRLSGTKHHTISTHFVHIITSGKLSTATASSTSSMGAFRSPVGTTIIRGGSGIGAKPAFQTIRGDPSKFRRIPSTI